MKVPPKVVARFWSKVEKTDTCWLWRGAGDRYGKFGWVDDDGWHLHIGAHRAAYLFANGHIDPRLDICHTCDTPKCVNPAHLFLGTATDNMRDCVAKGRHFSPQRLRTHCAHGHEFTPGNTRIKVTAAKGRERVCRTCARLRSERDRRENPEKYLQMSRRYEAGRKLRDTPERRARRLDYFRRYNALRRVEAGKK